MQPPQAVDAVPLTMSDKMTLLLGIVPFCAWIVILVLVVAVLEDILGKLPVLLMPLIVVVVLVTGYTAFLHTRDLLSGMALVHDDVLVRSWRSGTRGGGRFYGRFANLGKLRLIRSAYGKTAMVEHCRITYSPASKIVWCLEPLPN